MRIQSSKSFHCYRQRMLLPSRTQRLPPCSHVPRRAAFSVDQVRNPEVVVKFERPCDLRTRVAVASCEVEEYAQIRIDDQRQRVQLCGSLAFCDRFIVPR